MATNIDPRVLAGDSPGGPVKIVLVTLAVIATLAFTYIGLWLTTDDTAFIPGKAETPGKPIPLPFGVYEVAGTSMEIKPTAELQAVREAGTKAISGYAVSDAASGAYVIPIDRAIDLIAQRGVGSATTPAPAAKAGK